MNGNPVWRLAQRNTSIRSSSAAGRPAWPPATSWPAGAVIFTGGYRPDYQSWLPWTEAFDDLGFPIQTDGASTIVEDLYFVGVPYLRTRKSPLLLGVGDDATVVANTIAAR